MKEENSNGLHDVIAQAIEEMKHEQGKNVSLDKINLAELQRRTGISRAKLRRLKKNDFALKPHGLQGRKAAQTVLTGYTGILDKLPYPGRYQRLGMPGAAPGCGLSRWIDHGQGLYRRPPLPGTRQATAGGSPGNGSRQSRERPFRWTGASPGW